MQAQPPRESAAHVFAELLGERYAHLPPAVRAFHDRDDAQYQGWATVRGADHVFARALRWWFGFPALGERVPVWIAVDAQRSATGERLERWRRRFGTRRFASRFRCDRRRGLLAETFGAFRFGFALRVEDARMHWRFQRWSLGPLPLPRALGPRIVSWEGQDPDGAYRFYSQADFPLLGRLIHYDGRVVPTEPATVGTDLATAAIDP